MFSYSPTTPRRYSGNGRVTGQRGPSDSSLSQSTKGPQRPRITPDPEDQSGGRGGYGGCLDVYYLVSRHQIRNEEWLLHMVLK